LEPNFDDIEPTSIPTVVSGSTDGKENKLNLLAPSVSASSSGPRKKIVKSLKLSEITKALSPEETHKQMLGSVQRILESGEKLDEVKTRLLSSIAVNSPFDIRYCKRLFKKYKAICLKLKLHYYLLYLILTF